jgi:hypothetical protein
LFQCDCSSSQETEWGHHCREPAEWVSNEEKGKGDPLRFYSIAQGSIEEFRTDLILAKDLAPGAVSELRQLLEEIRKWLEPDSQAILSS